MVIENEKLLNALTVLGNAVAKKIIKSVAEQMVELQVENGVLYGYTSDTINYMRVAITDTTEDLLAVVDYNTLINLVKVNSDKTITLTTDDRALSIKSDSIKCKLPILKDSSDNIVQISKFWKISRPTDYKQIDFTTLKAYLPIIKTVIIENFVIPCYSNVYFAKDYVLASDTDNAIKITESYFDENVLLSAKTVEFLAQLQEVDCAIADKKLFINNDNIEFIALIQDSSEYQAEDISDLFTVKMDYSAVISGDKYNTGLITGKLFNFTEIGLKFTTDGLYLIQPTNDFSFRVSNSASGDFDYTLKMEFANRLSISKEDITVNYGDKQMILVAHDNIQGLFSTGASA